MNHIKETMAIINEVNDLFYKIKYLLLNAEEQIIDIREKADIEAVRVHAQAGIKEILKTFYPVSTPEQIVEAMARAVAKAKDRPEHIVKMKQIISDAVATGAYDHGVSVKEHKPTCHFDYSDDVPTPNWKEEEMK